MRKDRNRMAQGQTGSAWLGAKISECNFINSCVFQWKTQAVNNLESPRGDLLQMLERVLKMQ